MIGVLVEILGLDPVPAVQGNSGPLQIVILQALPVGFVVGSPARSAGTALQPAMMWAWSSMDAQIQVSCVSMLM